MTVFRFAPSPNGHLHLGHAFSALTNQMRVQEAGGRLLLRIEDIDAARCRPEYEAALHEDLAWLGLRFDPPLRRQSAHLADYRAALAKLDAMHLIYPAYETRSDIARRVAAYEVAGASWPRDPDGAPLYPGVDRASSAAARESGIASGMPFAWRLKMDEALTRVGPLTWQEDDRVVAADPAAWGDVVLARKDTPTSYHLAVTIDDALQGVTHVVRGLDLFHATSVHRLLQTLLGLPQPIYHHHRLILDGDGNKLSKSSLSTGLREMRAAGVSPGELRGQLGFA